MTQRRCGFRPAALVGLTLTATTLLTAAPTGAPEVGTGAADRSVPTIEVVAPGAFDVGRRAEAAFRVDYQVNATVLIPLLFTSIPLVGRDDVGVARFGVRDLDGPEPVRAYEFFAASDPRRARGLNRLGFIREVVRPAQGGAAWTAQFGVISSDRAESRESAEARIDAAEGTAAPQPMSVIDAVIRPERATSDVVRLTLGGSWRAPGDLYADVMALWTDRPADEERELDNASNDYRAPVGFLGGIQHSLRLAAADLAAGHDPARHRFPYVHNSRVFFLELRGHDVDDDRGRAYREAGLIAASDILHELDYRVVDTDGDEEESFELWTTLPSAAAVHGPQAPPIMPVAFEFRPRSFLELRAVRIGATAAPPP